LQVNLHTAWGGTKTEDRDNLKEIEEEIDTVSAQIWGLTRQELKDIKLSLEELK